MNSSAAMSCRVLLRRCSSTVSVLHQRSVLPYPATLSVRPSLVNSCLFRAIPCQDHCRLLTLTRSYRVFSTLPDKGLMEGSDLSTKKCIPCSSKDIHAMSRESAMELLPQVKNWELVTDNDVMKLQRSWKAKSFTKGLEFFQLIANVAEAEGHHPDLHLVGWNNVKIEIWTHSVACPKPRKKRRVHDRIGEPAVKKHPFDGNETLTNWSSTRMGDLLGSPCVSDSGGLTENDFILASKIDSLDTEYLLRKKKIASS